MEPTGLLLCSKKLTTYPFPEPEESSLQSPILFLSEPFKIILPGLPMKTLSCRFPQ
jgi:hypothetical protein